MWKITFTMELYTVTKNFSEKRHSFAHFNECNVIKYILLFWCETSAAFFISFIVNHKLHCTKKSSFPIRISTVNVTKSAVYRGLGHIY